MYGGLYPEHKVDVEEVRPIVHGRTRSGRVVNVDIIEQSPEKVCYLTA